MKGKKEMSITELFLYGGIQFILAVMLLFNSFTYITNQFIVDGHIEGGPTKQKGLLAMLSLLERGWWKYPIVLIFGTIGYLMIKEARQKLNKRD